MVLGVCMIWPIPHTSRGAAKYGGVVVTEHAQYLHIIKS